MRDFRDAKAMARALRDALKAKGVETTHSESLELIATADSPLEEAGFELSVPRDTTKVSRPPHVAFADCR
jgi:hypothetical protein